MNRVCVFCGSSPGSRPEYLQAAEQLGQMLAQRKIGLVYGGGRLGLMGAVARATVEAGGEVVGIIPRDLFEKEVAFTDLIDLRVVGSMHERKALMADLADGFIGLPGGLGTIEEFFEVLTWAQLGIHRKPCGLLNVAGYYTTLLHFIEHTVAEQFIAPEHQAMILVEEEPAALLHKFETYQPPTVDKAARAKLLSRDQRLWHSGGNEKIFNRGG